MSEKTLHDVSLVATASWIAGTRALENMREEDRLFEDPWAAALAGPEGIEWARAIGPLALTMLIRTRYFDDFLKKVTAEQGVRQVVLMAPGLDTRAFRLNWPDGTVLYELDQPRLFSYKEPILKAAGARATCERQIIPVDLTGLWADALLEAGFDQHRPAAWLVEGFLFYLMNEDITRVLDGVTDLAAPGSSLGFDIVNSVLLHSERMRHWIDKMAKSGVPWVGSLDDPAGFLARRGWKATVTATGQHEAHYGRWPFPVTPGISVDEPHHWLVTAHKG